MIRNRILLGTLSACLLFGFPVKGQDEPPAHSDWKSQETEISVAVPTAADEERKLGALVVHIEADGSIRVGEKRVSLKKLNKKPAAVAAQYEDQPILIRGDRNVKYQRIVEVIDICTKAGIWNISFATQRQAPSD